MPLDHVGLTIPTAHFSATVAFYTAALAPLGYKQIMSLYGGMLVALGVPGGAPDFWLSSEAARPGKPASGPMHLAFTAKDRKTVDACHAAGVKAGGEDNGKPGIRETSHPSYYGAYVTDPAGNNFEVVNHYEAA